MTMAKGWDMDNLKRIYAIGIALIALSILTLLAKFFPYNLVDGQILNVIQQPHSARFIEVALVLARCGGLPVTAALVGLLVLWQMIRRHYRTAQVLIGSFVGTVALSWLLKTLIVRPRPHFMVQDIQTYGSSFPSAHSAYAIMLGLLCCHIVKQQTSYHNIRWDIMMMLLWAGIMGWSRMYLGVHYLSDVLAGYCIAVVAVCFVTAVLQKSKHELNGGVHAANFK